MDDTESEYDSDYDSFVEELDQKLSSIEIGEDYEKYIDPKFIDLALNDGLTKYHDDWVENARHDLSRRQNDFDMWKEEMRVRRRDILRRWKKLRLAQAHKHKSYKEAMKQKDLKSSKKGANNSNNKNRLQVPTLGKGGKSKTAPRTNPK